MRVMRGVLAVGALAVGLEVVGMLVVGMPEAQAGQPWWCVCKGKPKRFIASTHACEIDQYMKTHKNVDENRRIVFKACTRSQWEAWNTKACRREGCQPPKF